MQGLQALDQFKNFVSKIGGLGRYEDTYIVHAAEGETVVPMEVLDRNPLLKKRLFKTMVDMGIEPGRYIVGKELKSKNPVTGQPEFFFKKVIDRIKKAAADISGYAAPIIGAMYGAPAGALAGGVLGSFKRENPGDPTQGLNMALRGGLAGLATNLATGQPLMQMGGGARGLYMKDLTGAESFNPVELGRRMLGQGVRPEGDSAFGLDEFLKTGGEDSKYRFMDKYFPEKAPGPEESLIDAQINKTKIELNSIRNRFDTGDLMMDRQTKKDITDLEKEIFNLERLKLEAARKEGIGPAGMTWKEMLPLYLGGTLGLGALIDYTSDDVDAGPEPQTLPIGVPYQGILNPQLQYAQGGVLDLQGGGESRGPGTGTSDSIPAMLSDGEFVMTADAVRGAGGGDRREGARRMYEAMDRLEARA